MVGRQWCVDVGMCGFAWLERVVFVSCRVLCVCVEMVVRVC